MKKWAFLLVVAIMVLFVYNLLMFYDNYSPFGRMRETPAVRPYEIPLPIMQAGLVPVDGGEALYRAAAPENLKSPLSTGRFHGGAGRRQTLLHLLPAVPRGQPRR